MRFRKNKNAIGQMALAACMISTCLGNCLAVQEDDLQALKSDASARLGRQKPEHWGENLSGIKTKVKSRIKVLALTLDACPPREYGYDSKLINFLIKEKIPATLFISGKWIDRFPKTFQELASNPLFEIANHGSEHKPCSVSGKSIYGLKGTASIGEVVDEIERNARRIAMLTGHKPIFYRAGGNYYDEVGLQVAESLGNTVVGYSIAGDAGASYSKAQVRQTCLAAKPGAIILCHMNHPESETAEGLMEAIPELLKQGFVFVKLSDYPLE